MATTFDPDWWEEEEEEEDYDPNIPYEEDEESVEEAEEGRPGMSWDEIMDWGGIIA